MVKMIPGNIHHDQSIQGKDEGRIRHIMIQLQLPRSSLWLVKEQHDITDQGKTCWPEKAYHDTPD